MAWLRDIVIKTQFLQKSTNFSNFFQNRSMAIFPSYYIQPVYKKEKQQELTKTGEIKEITHVPTKPALNDQTCSASQDPLLNLFINYVMRHGKKQLARELVEKSLENVKRIQIEKYHKAKTEEDKMKVDIDAKSVFYKAVANCKPVLSLQPIKRGGVTYQVPIPISDKKSQFLSMTWLIDAAKDKERTVHFPEQMARELIDAANNGGRVVKKKQDLHKQCEANRAYAHYRWS